MEFKRDKLTIRLKYLRYVRGYSQRDVAKILGISIHKYRHFEDGTYNISFKMLFALANLYLISVPQLVGLNTNNYKEEKSYDNDSV